MTLGFSKEEFKEKILRGTKIHSIREDKADRWKDGILIHFVTGNRTKHRNEFLLYSCTGIQEITITYHKGLREVCINDKVFYWDYEGQNGNEFEMEQLAYNDGFDSIEDFFAYCNLFLFTMQKSALQVFCWKQ